MTVTPFARAPVRGTGFQPVFQKGITGWKPVPTLPSHAALRLVYSAARYFSASIAESGFAK